MRNLTVISSAMTLALMSCALDHPDSEPSQITNISLADEAEAISVVATRTQGFALDEVLPAADPIVTVTNFARFRLLDAATQSINANGTKVQLWDQNFGAQQTWIFHRETGNNFTFRNVVGGRCLDAATQSMGANGTLVQLWDCNGGDQQRWNPTDNGDGTLTIRNALSHRCLDAATQSIDANGTKIQLWDCNGGEQQRWF